MRQRVHELARRWRYSPNHIARSLRKRSTKTLGVLFPFTTLPYYATLLDALDVEADARGLHLEVHFHQWSEKQEAAALTTLVERRVDGLILIPTAASSTRTVRECVPPGVGIPVVFLGAQAAITVPPFVRGRVGADMCRGSVLLAEHLLEMGHRCIAFLAASDARSAKRMDKVIGLKSAIKQQRDARLVIVPLPEDAEIQAMYAHIRERGLSARVNFLIDQRLAEAFLRLSPRPTVAVTSNETMAHTLLSSLGAGGLRVPDDVSVACYDGTFLSAHGFVPLTCVAQPFELIARRVIELVTAGDGDGVREYHKLQLLPPTLVKRASVARVRDSQSAVHSTN
jgi:DNA-binding LacI/PurR family transcriptional regulator